MYSVCWGAPQQDFIVWHGTSHFPGMFAYISFPPLVFWFIIVFMEHSL